MEIKAFIFDIDGTLVDTRQLHIDAWQRAFSEFGIEVPADQIQSQLGRRAIDIAKALLPESKQGETMRVVEAKWRIFRELHPAVKPLPKVKELFDLLHRRGIVLALATSTIRQDAEFYIDILSLRGLIGTLVAAEDIQHSKPHPEIFLKAAARLSVSPEEAVMVGDSPHDMRAAKDAGMIAIGVLSGGFPKEDLHNAGADHIYRDIEDLYEHVEDIFE
ncbi:MAG TPA: HAD family phosphatase [Anaerolineae bacterium]|jgi:HAD superfamily hydrolase (TIGR01509 family)|nr:HAD family phosphatase [Anaerolineae bacterium]